jgi:hypothetical protein
VANIRVDQVAFTHGQLDPRVQSRVDWANYYKAAKLIQNGLVIPQGGVQRRWGSVFVDRCTVVGANLTQAEISTMVYNDNVLYLMLWENISLKIYLENILIATVVTQYLPEDIQTLRFSQIQTRVVITTGNYKPQELLRSADGAQPITAFNAGNNTLTAAVGYNAGQILPVQFANTGAFPATTPALFAGRDYFIKMITATTFQIYSSSGDAVNGVNTYVVTSAGVNATVNVQNSWTIRDITFINYPAYDFNGGYSAITFTPSAVSGNITLTASGNIFTADMQGGVFEGNGGIMRIGAAGFVNATHVTGFTSLAFANTNAIQGSLSFLGQPAWSATLGWPSTSTFFQNRLVLANSYSLPNGQWLSVINEVYNFDDSEGLADSAISSYPEAGTMSVIQSMISGRSLIAHTNTGNYSTPVQNEIAVTPSNYVLTEQNKIGVSTLQPVFIDNQVFFVDRSGNNVINMIWEFTQSSYVTNNISVASSNLINKPVDMTAFAEPNFLDGFFVIFVNVDGTLAVLQTLHEEGILAFSGASTSSNIVNDLQSDATQVPSLYMRVNSAMNRCWFLVNRSVPIAQATTNITGFNAGANTLQANGHGMTVGVATMIAFTGAPVPLTVPAVNSTQYFWANATDANDFRVYGNATDAAAGTNPYTITNAGTTATVTPWVNTPQLYIEEVNFNYYTDSTVAQTFNAPTTAITGLSHLNGQVVQVVADGYVLQNETVFNGQITIEEASSVVSVGVPYTTILNPLPPVIQQVGGSLYQPRHIRNLYVNYYQTIGSTVQSYGMPVVTMQQVVLGALPVPQTGVFEYTLMEGWDGATPVDIQIQQSAPLPMTILALSYILEV